MSAHRYARKAREGLAAALADVTSGFVAQLRAIETAEGYDSNALPDPEAIIAYEAPEDPRSPLVQVYFAAREQGGAEVRDRIAGIECVIGITYNSDNDLETAARTMDHFEEAVLRMLEADPTCGGRVGQAWSSDSNTTGLQIINDSVTRHGRYIGVLVRVHDP